MGARSRKDSLQELSGRLMEAQEVVRRRRAEEEELRAEIQKLRESIRSTSDKMAYQMDAAPALARPTVAEATCLPTSQALGDPAQQSLRPGRAMQMLNRTHAVPHSLTRGEIVGRFAQGARSHIMAMRVAAVLAQDRVTSARPSG